MSEELVVRKDNDCESSRSGMVVKGAQAKRFAEVLLAYCEGKTVQFRDADGKWVDCSSGSLGFIHSFDRYRLPPKPSFCRVGLFDGPTRRPCVIASDSPMDWDAFAKFTPNFGGWLTEPLEYEP